MKRSSSKEHKGDENIELKKEKVDEEPLNCRDGESMDPGDENIELKKEKVDEESLNCSDGESTESEEDDDEDDDIYEELRVEKTIQKYVDMNIDNKYKIDSYIAHGGYGYIFLCTDMKSSSRKAVKVLLTDGTEGPENQIFNEIRVNSKLKSQCPNIPETLMLAEELLQYNKKHFLIFELMQCDLFHYVCVSETPEKVSLESIRVVLSQLCLALAFLHSQKIVHKDVKPQNILVSFKSEKPIFEDNLLHFQNIKTKLSDLGNAVSFRDVGRLRLWTQPYKSLEILLDLNLNEKVDVWAAACVCLFLATGDTIFESVSEDDQIDKIINFTDNLRSALENKYYNMEENLLAWCDKKMKHFNNPVQTNTRFGDFLNLLGKMMDEDINQRASVEEVLKTNFITEEMPSRSIGFPDNLDAAQHATESV